MTGPALKWFLPALLLFFMPVPCTASAAPEVPAAASRIDSGIPDSANRDLSEHIERAVVLGSLEDLTRLRTDHRQHLESPDGDPNGGDRYRLAYLNWRIGQLLPEDKKKKKQLLKEAKKQLDLLLETAEEDAEAHALRGSVIGDRIEGMFGGMFLGPKASASLKRALDLAPENPRVALQRGVGHFFTPKTFGGGLERAEEELRRARDLFRKEPADHPWPNWGRIDTFAWLGQVLAKTGRVDEARALYEEALEREPEHAWIRAELLPELDELDEHAPSED